jgi:hypothetical protein
MSCTFVIPHNLKQVWNVILSYEKDHTTGSQGNHELLERVNVDIAGGTFRVILQDVIRLHLVLLGMCAVLGLFNFSVHVHGSPLM